jgi:hypothetical protein
MLHFFLRGLAVLAGLAFRHKATGSIDRSHKDDHLAKAKKILAIYRAGYGENSAITACQARYVLALEQEMALKSWR